MKFVYRKQLNVKIFKEKVDHVYVIKQEAYAIDFAFKTAYSVLVATNLTTRYLICLYVTSMCNMRKVNTFSIEDMNRNIN